MPGLAFAKILRCKPDTVPIGYPKPSIKDARAAQKHIAELIRNFTSGKPINLLAPDIEKLVHSATVFDAVWDAVTAEREESACHLLEILQRWRDNIPNTHPFHNNTIYIIVKLASKSGMLPPSLLLRGVNVPRLVPRFNGGCGQIYEGRYGNTSVAVKKPGFSSDSEIEDWYRPFTRESLIWRQLKHPNILEFIGIDDEVFKREKTLALVTPWMEMGTLDDYVRCPDYKPEILRDHFLRGIASGLQYLHSLKITHSDIKGQNVLITTNKTAVLADFGLVVIGETTKNKPSTIDGQVGTPDFSAPELLLGRILRSNRPVDIYAFACLCLKMWTGQKSVWPATANIVGELRAKRRPARPDPRKCVGGPMHDDIWLLIEQCWSEDPNERPKIDEVVAFFNRDGPADRGYMFITTAHTSYMARPGTSEISVHEGESLRVVTALTGFYEVRTASGQNGFIPASVIPDPTMFTAVATKTYVQPSTGGVPSNQHSLSFNKDDQLSIIYIVGKCWLARNHQGHIGTVPPECMNLVPGWKEGGKKSANRLRWDHHHPGTPYALQLRRNTAIAVKRVCGEWTLAETIEHRLGVVRTSYLKPV